LAEVAEKTGFPASTLSKMENDKVALTYDKIQRLSDAMGVDIGVFFAQHNASPSSSGRRSIVREGDGSVIETENYHHRFVANDLLNKRFIPIFGEVYARSVEEFAEMPRHAGEEFTYVIEGVLELHTELYSPVRLVAGESIYFDSGISHAYVNAGPGRCRVLTMCAGDEAQLRSALQKAPLPAKAAAESPRRTRTVAEPARAKRRAGKS
jgi:transcriptional regulator with XRE-family HTH domain